MHTHAYHFILLTALTALSTAHPAPALVARNVTSLNAAAAAEAQPRDNTATWAFSSVQIKTADGMCLFVDPLSGDFRENLTPMQVQTCDGSAGQRWDVITAGQHQETPGDALIVSSLTQACLNFDPRRAAGNQVLLFSCGGRADGGGSVTNSQQSPFQGGNAVHLSPANANGTCIVPDGNVLGTAACDGSQAQEYIFR